MTVGIMNRYQTYRFICQCLVIDKDNSGKSGLINSIQSGDLNWKRFFKTGSNHLILQTIYRIFETHKILEFLPPEVLQELQRIYEINKDRNRQILDQALAINSILRAEHIEAIFLKGSAHMMNDLYYDMGDRIMADIDLLVPKEDILPAVEALKKKGYVAPVALSEGLLHIYRKHHPRLHKPGSPAFVEIHWEAVRPEYTKDFNSSLLYSRKVLSKSCDNCYTLSTEDNVIHNFIHSQLEHRGHNYARVYLRNLYDLYLLSFRCKLTESFSSFGNYSRRSAAYLNLARETFGPAFNYKGSKVRSRLFLFRHRLNVRYITLSFIIQLISRFYISYIKKTYFVLTNKNIRKLAILNLRSRAWYKQHFKRYKNIFRPR